jgi:hypothetical protein
MPKHDDPDFDDRGWNMERRCPNCQVVIDTLYDYLVRGAELVTFECPHCDESVELRVWTQYVLQRPVKDDGA